MDLLSLPVVMVENIVSYLTYDEIAKTRLVCKDLNIMCKRMLNRGFLVIERRHAVALKTVKAQLPRRESERRYHPLARHCDILSSIETRISMLNMTYSKYIDCGLCCFIPGKVIDEIKRVLEIVESTQTPPRAHEVLQELRDISSMAIEHFDDKISPAFRKQLQEGAVVAHTHALPRHDNALTQMAIKQELSFLRRRSLLNAKLSLYMASRYKKVYKEMVSYRSLLIKQRKVMREMTTKQTEQDAAIADLKKRIEECDVKYSELTHTNQAIGGKAATSTSSAAPQPLRHFASQIKLDLSVLPIGKSNRNQGKLLPNIKPRKPLIRLPSLSEDTEPPNKKIKQDKPEQKQSQEKRKYLIQEKEKEKKMASTLDIIRDFAKEFRNFTKSPPDCVPSTSQLGKRSFSFSSLNDDFGTNDNKKPKLD